MARPYAVVSAAALSLMLAHASPAQTYRESGGSVLSGFVPLTPGAGPLFVPGNPGHVRQAGTTGVDYSANKPSIPNVGASFGSTGPYANYVLIATVPANAFRNTLDIENTSGAQIAIVRDDGGAATGSTPANASVFALGPGSATVGAQGGSYVSQTFKGRAQIYAPSPTAFVAAFAE